MLTTLEEVELFPFPLVQNQLIFYRARYYSDVSEVDLPDFEEHFQTGKVHDHVVQPFILLTEMQEIASF